MEQSLLNSDDQASFKALKREQLALDKRRKAVTLEVLALDELRIAVNQAVLREKEVEEAEIRRRIQAAMEHQQETGEWSY